MAEGDFTTARFTVKGNISDVASGPVIKLTAKFPVAGFPDIGADIVDITGSNGSFNAIVVVGGLSVA